jgi:hypothetical protein
MKIDEILRISTQDFPIRKVKQLLTLTRDGYGFIDNLVVNYTESGDHRVIILTDDRNNEIAAYAGFISRMNGKVWQAKNLATYNEYKGNKLGAKIYKYVKEVMKKSIQSDIEQSPSAEILWTKTLPEIGLFPKIFDTETEYVIDDTNPVAYNNAIQKLYYDDENAVDKYRYTWILEKNDHYTEHSVLKEEQLLLPKTGVWYKFEEENK